jgi:hypothetical protein
MGGRMSDIRTELADAARKALGDGLAREDAAALVGEMGWLMAHVPEERGGLGLGHEGLAAIGKELGRALVPGPVVAQLGVIVALAHADAFDGRDALLEAAMGGAVMTTSLAPETVSPETRFSDLADYTVTCVPDADRAGHLLVLSGVRVSLVPLDAPGIVLTERPTWDRTRRLFDVLVPAAAPRIMLAEGMDAQFLSTRIHAPMLLALAADALGGSNTSRPAASSTGPWRCSRRSSTAWPTSSARSPPPMRCCGNARRNRPDIPIASAWARSRPMPAKSTAW